MLLLSTGGSPALAVLANPVEQRAFKADVVAEPFRFYPLVLQDFLTFGEKFLIQAGLFHKLAGRRRLWSRMSHAAREK